MSDATSELPSEDAKLVTLARGAKGRVSASEGAAVRDETGRTYASSSVNLPSLRLSALQAAVAQAAASGARGIEAATLMIDRADADADADVDVDEASAVPDVDGVSAVRDLGGVGVPVLVVDASGAVISTTTT